MVPIITIMSFIAFQICVPAYLCNINIQLKWKPQSQSNHGTTRKQPKRATSPRSSHPRETQRVPPPRLMERPSRRPNQTEIRRRRRQNLSAIPATNQWLKQPFRNLPSNRGSKLGLFQCQFRPGRYAFHFTLIQISIHSHIICLGDLGNFSFGEMQKPFSEASFALSVGEITQSVVHTASGSHLIMRTKIMPTQVRASHILGTHPNLSCQIIDFERVAMVD